MGVLRYVCACFIIGIVFALYRDVIACKKANGVTDSTRRDARKQTRCIS